LPILLFLCLSSHEYFGYHSNKSATGGSAWKETRDRCAVAHSTLVIAYNIIQRHEPYHKLGGDYFDKQHLEAAAKRLGVAKFKG
jgi:hypothetical protein